jgi:VIT1/CCC1 family predicted Fe2+/Mn2+ transporter
MDDENGAPVPASVVISPAAEPADVATVDRTPVGEASSKAEPESNVLGFIVGVFLPVLVLLILTSTSLLSAGAWEFNRRVEVTIQSDDDGVFRFDADPKVSHGVKESVYIIFIDPAYTGGAMAYRPEIHIGVIEDCEVESVNTVCMYHLKQDGNGDLEFTKLGEYDQVNHTAEFVLNGEANESIGLRIDYYDHGAEEHYYEVEQPRNRTIVSVLLGAAFIGVLVYSALKNDGSLLGGVGISVVVIAGLAVLAFVSALLEALSG